MPADPRLRLLPPPRNPTASSLLLALGLTAAMLLSALVASTGAPARWLEPGSKPVDERITYVAPTPVRTPIPVPPATRPATPSSPAAPRAPSPGGATTTAASSASAPIVAPIPVPGITTDTGAAHARQPTPSGVEGAAGAAAPTRGPTVSPMPLRVGAELPADKPLSREQRDSALKAAMRAAFSPEAVRAAIQMAADARARGRDEANRELGRSSGGGQTTVHATTGVSIGFFGGKSAAQRKKDEAVDADTRARLARADSVRRARLRADSLTRAVP